MDSWLPISSVSYHPLPSLLIFLLRSSQTWLREPLQPAAGPRHCSLSTSSPQAYLACTFSPGVLVRLSPWGSQTLITLQGPGVSVQDLHGLKRTPPSRSVCVQWRSMVLFFRDVCVSSFQAWSMIRLRTNSSLVKMPSEMGKLCKHTCWPPHPHV